MVGVELEDEVSPDLPIDLTNGTFNGRRYFKCAPGKAFFVDPKFCSVDRRFDNDMAVAGTSSGNSSANKAAAQNAKQMFGQMDCPIISGRVAPLSKSIDKILREKQMSNLLLKLLRFFF